MTRCPTCGHESVDYVAVLGEHNRIRGEFSSAYPNIYCPACKKRVSSSFDSVGSEFESETVEMVCSHCDHRWLVPRRKEATTTH